VASSAPPYVPGKTNGDRRVTRSAIGASHFAQGIVVNAGGGFVHI